MSVLTEPRLLAFKKAQHLRMKYGHMAELHAAISATAALESKNKDACSYWKTVLDLLESEECLSKLNS